MHLKSIKLEHVVLTESDEEKVDLIIKNKIREITSCGYSFLGIEKYWPKINIMGIRLVYEFAFERTVLIEKNNKITKESFELTKRISVSTYHRVQTLKEAQEKYYNKILSNLPFELNKIPTGELSIIVGLGKF